MTINANGALKLETEYSSEFNLPGLSGSGDFSLIDTQGRSVDLDVGSNNADTTYSGAIGGMSSISITSELVKVGTGTLTLSGANTFPQLAVVSGTVRVTGSIANNGSLDTLVVVGSDFSKASLVRRVLPGGSYAGFGSASYDGHTFLRLSADIRAGQNGGTAPADLAMQWRTPNVNDARRLVADVLNLSGMSAFAGNYVQTDPFALQMTYNPSALGGVESVLAADGLIDLAWLNPALHQPFGIWQDATLGNFGTGLPGDVFQNYQGSWDAFAAANGVTDANVGNFLGSYGVDTATHTVWAVVDFNGQFSVVPEPPTALLLLIATATWLTLTRSQNRLRRLTASAVVIFVASGLTSRSVFAGTSGTWISTTGGFWSSAGKWASATEGGTGIIADGVDAVADFSKVNVGKGIEVVLDSPRTVGTLIFDGGVPSNGSSSWILYNNNSSANKITLAVSSGTPVVQVDNATVNVQAGFAGNQGFIKTGNGTLFLGGDSLSGVARLLSGTLQIGSLRNTTLEMDGGALAFSTPHVVIGGLEGSSNFSLPSAELQIGYDNDNTTYSGVISGLAFNTLTKILHFRRSKLR